MGEWGTKFFSVDFYCHEARLIVELDGAIHAHQKKQDAARDAWMTATGLTVLRFNNACVYTDLATVLTEIISHLSKPLSRGERGLG